MSGWVLWLLGMVPAVQTTALWALVRALGSEPDVPAVVAEPVAAPALALLPIDHDQAHDAVAPALAPVAVAAFEPNEAEVLADEVWRAEQREAALSEAITAGWARLEEAGATNRGRMRRAVSTLSADGEDSEDAVRALWREVRTLGAERRAVRRLLSIGRAELRALTMTTAAQAA